MFLARRTCNNELVVRANLVDRVKIVIMEPEFRECNNIRREVVKKMIDVTEVR